MRSVMSSPSSPQYRAKSFLKVADTGSGEVRMRPHDGPMVPSRSDSVDKTAGSP